MQNSSTSTPLAHSSLVRYGLDFSISNGREITLSTIDEIEGTKQGHGRKGLIGGAGSYAAIRARLVAGNINSRRIRWIVGVGSDFLPEHHCTISSWQTACLFREDRTRCSTRALISYNEAGQRGKSILLFLSPDMHIGLMRGTMIDFKYLTPNLRLDQDSLRERQATAKVFHLESDCRRILANDHDPLSSLGRHFYPTMIYGFC